ncbi:unnamed protein product [Arabidopsis thaliana]|uniref:(thale cress) hypothetical protein n=1 Tax=Arabidopsis thaliana TaxID=3702 RepID=A0A7G2F6A7_ARATH|nr:unnamed protein product [Arabidopsis thaliana]
MKHLRREAAAIVPSAPPAVSPVVMTAVAIVAGTRIGLNMIKSGVVMVNAVAEPASVRPANTKKTIETTAAITT